MLHATLDPANSYFFSQRSRETHQRLQKTFDYQFLYGKTEEVLLAYDSKTPTAVEPLYRRRSSVRPTSARPTKRVSISQQHSIILPPIDREGPKLVSKDPLDAVELKSSRSDKKVEFSRDGGKESTSPRRSEYKFSEAKFNSSSILSQLSIYLTKISEQLLISLPVDIHNLLLQTHDQLTAEVVFEKREWQTEGYLDLYQSRNRHPFLSQVPKDPATRESVESSIGRIAEQQEKERSVRLKAITEKKEVRAVRKKRQERGKAKTIAKSQERKRARMSTELSSQRKSDRSPERPMTARSVMSSVSMRSDYSRHSSADERETQYDFDVLPAELRPSILHYRRESRTPKTRSPGPRTRLERFRMQREPKKKKRAISLKLSPDKETEEGNQLGRGDRPGTALLRDKNQPMTTIPFSLVDTDCDWIVKPGADTDPEAHTLLMWMKEDTRQREEEKMLAKQRGEDGPLTVKFYSDPQNRSIRLKHQRSSTFPLPAVLSKLPPSSLTSFSKHSMNDAHLVGEGLKTFLLVLPDGSGYCNYASGRQAVCMSRSGGKGVRGLYTVVFDDSEDQSMLGYFSPSGKACLYHPCGAIHLLSNEEGGATYNEDGRVIRKWVWPPPPHQKLPVSISIQLNAHLSFHCMALTNMVLRFSSRGQSYKLSVGPSIESLVQQKLPGGAAPEKLLSDIPFTSRAGLGRRVHEGERTGRRGGRKRIQSVGSEDEGSGQWDNEKAIKELSTYREKIRMTVNDWMEFTRQSVGLRLPVHLTRTPSRSTTPISSPLFSPRAVQSAMGFVAYAGETYSRPSTRTGHTRCLTHPLPSRVGSQMASYAIGSSPSPDEEGEEMEVWQGVEQGERSRTVSPPLPRPASPLDYIRPQSTEHSRPFRLGRGGLQKRHRSPLRCGCPVALHHMLLNKQDTLKPCKCDKRRPPYISDLEYDVFLLSHVPREQLVVVCVLSSIVENSCPCEPMLDSLHYHQNRIRFSPCTQCLTDSYRLVKYDLCCALRDLTMSVPLLVQRHNVSPGMFLMYMGGKLVHADFMFNGYGTTKKDFLKQIQRCIEGAKKGHFLPSDYKFTRRTGTKIQGKNAWAYPLCGVLEDLIPLTPGSGSGSSSSRTETGSRPTSRVLITAGSRISDLGASITEIESEFSSKASLLSASTSQQAVRFRES